MAPDTIVAKNSTSLRTAGQLIEVGRIDTVYGDVYIRRARHYLSTVMDESSYRAIGSTQKEINELLRQTRSAVLERDWGKAAEISARADQLRKMMDELTDVAAIAKNVYDSDAIAFDPFSPGKHLGPNAQAKQNAFRAQVLGMLAALGNADPTLRGFYDQRSSYFSGLELRSSAEQSESRSRRSRAQLEQLALEAVERGDITAAHSLTKELHDLHDPDENGLGGGSSSGSRYECPVDLAVPFPPDANSKAREFGMVATHIAAAAAEIKTAAEIIFSHAWDPTPPTPELEHEGVLRSEVLIESKTPAQFVTEELKILAQQFLQQIFINSGGARYLPRISAETALVEDFAETEAADAPSKLLDALRLPHRRGLARSEIDKALMRFGPEILAEQLHLDPIEYRLVCIPYDLYVRLGRDRSWGQWHHWTHFDGYQVVRDNRLSALVGGDGRFGGINDLLSISRTDAREGVYVRFAVVRRARMVARWR
jgi:hypothetical protein